MFTENWKPVEFSNRIKSRIQARGTRGEIAKCLAELVKNADDTYYRLQKQGLPALGSIEIGYWHSMMKKRSAVTGFYVRDWGEGMSQATLAKAYESYGEDTAFGGRNAAIGVGGKDAFYGMEQCYVVSVKDHVAVCTSFRTSKDGVLECTGARIAGAQILDKINKEANLRRDPLQEEKNGTIVLFRIPKNAHHPHFQRLEDRLEKYYTLRNIFEDSSRKVTLIDVKKGTSTQISHKPLKGEIVHQSQICISHSGHSYDVEVIIYEANENLSKERDVGDDLLVQDDQGAVLDNTLFGFENYSAANSLFGKVIIHGWRDLYKVDETVLTDNREGLDFNNRFNKELRDKLSKILKPLIEANADEQTKTADLNSSLKKRINDAFSYINKLVEKEIGGEFEGEIEKLEEAPEGLQFSLSSMRLLLDQEKRLYLYVNPERVPPDSAILLDLTGDGVRIDPSTVVRTMPKYEERKVPSISVKIKGIKVGGHSTLKATYNELQTQTEINVVPEEVFSPKNGFAFEPEKVSITKGKKRNLRLVIDTRVVRRGTVVMLESQDERIRISYGKFIVLPPNLGENLREELLPVIGEVEGIHSQVIARTMAGRGEIEASCSVRVVEKEPPRQFLAGFHLDRERDGHQRASYEKGMVYVHVKSPVLQSYFGDEQAKLNEEKRVDAVAILADTILQCVTKEWAKYLLDKGVEVALGSNPEIEVERIRNNLEFKYGAEIHQKISAKVGK